jgi:DNA polymerase III subunit delta
VAETAPTVYILNGDDEFAIAQFLDELEAGLGDPATTSMNTSRLDGGLFNLDTLLSIAGAMPFLAKRRLVILTNPLGRLTSESARGTFRNNLEKVPATTALILVENRLLTSDDDRRKEKIHWLERWGLEQGERALVKTFRLPRGAEMVRRIQDAAKRYGGQFTAEAADQLSLLVDGDPRLADQEVQKLLAYVNYQRPVDFADVDALTVDVGQGDVFVMVDALANRNGKNALGMLHRLLEYQDYYSLFGMIVRQFRLLILARDVLDRNGQNGDVLRELGRLKLRFPVNQLVPQARRFSPADLEQIYHRLLDIDQAVKTSQMTGELALETLVAALTNPPGQPRPGR